MNEFSVVDILIISYFSTNQTVSDIYKCNCIYLLNIGNYNPLLACHKVRNDFIVDGMCNTQVTLQREWYLQCRNPFGYNIAALDF